MKPKSQKVVLKSDIFKIKRTPEKINEKQKKLQTSIRQTARSQKSPLFSKRDQERVDPTQIFEKVCCPNCRFIFKFIKKTDDGPLHTNRKRQKQTNVSIQTDEFQMTKTNIFKTINEYSQKIEDSPHHQELFVYKSSIPMIDSIKQQQRSQKNSMKNAYRLQKLSYSKVNNNPNNPNRSSQKQSDKSMSMSKKYKPKQKQNSLLSVAERSELERQFKKEYVQRYIAQTLNSIQEKSVLLDLIKSLPSSMQIPAFQKMLVKQLSTEQSAILS